MLRFALICFLLAVVLAVFSLPYAIYALYASIILFVAYFVLKAIGSGPSDP